MSLISDHTKLYSITSTKVQTFTDLAISWAEGTLRIGKIDDA